MSKPSFEVFVIGSSNGVESLFIQNTDVDRELDFIEVDQYDLLDIYRQSEKYLKERGLIPNE